MSLLRLVLFVASAGLGCAWPSAAAPSRIGDTGVVAEGPPPILQTAAASLPTPAPPAPAPNDAAAAAPAEPAFAAELPPGLFNLAAPASRYANLAPWQCRQKLQALKLPVRPASGPALGIATPLRLSGPLQGVRFLLPGPRSPYGKLDCRLVLVLNDFAQVLRAHGVAQVRIDNFYRPHALLPRVHKGKKRNPSQHSYGLAADITEFKLDDGLVLNVERDWHGAIGGTSCGPESLLTEANPEAVKLRNIFCDVVAKRLFHTYLTPNYDPAHRNHLHLDIKRDARQRILH